MKLVQIDLSKKLACLSQFLVHVFLLVHISCSKHNAVLLRLSSVFEHNAVLLRLSDVCLKVSCTSKFDVFLAQELAQVSCTSFLTVCRQHNNKVTWDNKSIPAKWHLIPPSGFRRCSSATDGHADHATVTSVATGCRLIIESFRSRVYVRIYVYGNA